MSKNYQAILTDRNQITVSAEDSFVADESMRDYSDKKKIEDKGSIQLPKTEKS